MIVTYTCEKCFVAFECESKPAGYRFCSHHCANQHAYKLGRDELFPYAEIGARADYTMKRLEVSARTLRKALIKHDLYRLWASRRYKKCASPTVGASLASTASPEATSPSSGSAALMAGDTSCGG